MVEKVMNQLQIGRSLESVETCLSLMAGALIVSGK